MESAEENGNEIFVSNSYSAPITSSPPSQSVVMSTTGTPMKLVPIHSLYKDTTSITEDSIASIANGSENAKVSSSKGKARKLLETNKSKDLSFPYVNKIEKSLLVYSRRRIKGAMKSNAHMCNGIGSHNITSSVMDNNIGSPRKSNTQMDGGVGSPKNSNHMDNGIASTPTVCLAERLIQLTKLKQDRQTLGNDNNCNAHEVRRPDGERGSMAVVMEDKNTLDIVDGGEDEAVVQCDGIEGGVGLNDIESGDHGGTGKLKKSHSYVNDRSGNGSGWMKRKKPQKSTFEGIELFPDKRRKLEDRVWLRERGTRMQRAAKLASNWKLQSVKRRQSLPASVTKSETRGREQIATSNKRKWIEVGITEVNPMALLEYICKVYWPLDDKWYSGVINQYDAKNKKHHVNYIDGEEEWLLLAEEKFKLFVSGEEMHKLHLKNKEQMRINEMMNNLDYDEMAALAATMDDYQGEPGHGDLIWAKITGHSMWPAFVMDEPHANACDGLEPATREGSIPLQFFGSYDYARINSKQIMPFYRGFQRDLQSKNRTLVFLRALREAWRYLKELKLPEAMSKLQMQVVNAGSERENERNSEQSDGDEDCMGDERSEKIKKSVECLFSCPIVTGGLRVLSLGKIVKDSEHFHDEHHIWTEGYTVIRKFTSIKGPGRYAEYKMEVLRNPLQRSMPLFRITLEDGAEIDGSTPTECWKKIYARLEKSKQKIGNGLKAPLEKRRPYKSGSYMFGFSNKRIASLIQALPHARACSKYMDWDDKLAAQNRDEVLPAGYRPVNVQWKDLDRCSVCHMEEEYVNNVFLQCDKCRMMVHANCYGELEPVDGKLWHCKLCRPGAPKRWPACCLCPITGGAMKKTTCGRWAHLTCATWIPETCLVDIKRMEPIDGVNRISKDRWKLICSICEVPYGACIQCSEHNCRVAYHPLCARAAGLCVEVLEDKRVRHTGSTHEECEQLRLLSFCKKHRQPTDERSPTDQEGSLVIRDCSAYVPPSNPSGCARCEPYNFSERRGRKEPEAASIKRLFVENRPYLVSGCCKNGLWADMQGNARHGMESADQNTSMHQVDGSRNFISDKYDHMRATFRKRLAFGKSGIHGFGIFAKRLHKAGDMVIEYTGEIVRPIIADIREHFIYNSLVGAGTYMFRIDEERVIDATRIGSIAHLINHSCEPNCYSRAINVCGEDRIIIFAKRDIKQWEELTYDYRFFSIDEQLACYCGFPRCRGIVNVNDNEDQVGTISVPRRELTEWTPDDGE